ncbi:hypothetical protein ACWEOI_19310 [Nocardia sp. NPDC004340]|uniref:hypothetical protein n=1 Tax=Nocardia sp. CA-136227 TaxID=3239979 RepID=UPI003D98E4ED
MKAAARQRILAAAAGCLITAAAAGTAGAAPLDLQPAVEGPVAAGGPVSPVVAETGSFERALGGDVGFSVSQGSSDMYWNVVKLVVCDLLRAGPFICAPGVSR